MQRLPAGRCGHQVRVARHEAVGPHFLPRARRTSLASLTMSRAYGILPIVSNSVLCPKNSALAAKRNRHRNPSGLALYRHCSLERERKCSACRRAACRSADRKRPGGSRNPLQRRFPCSSVNFRSWPKWRISLRATGGSPWQSCIPDWKSGTIGPQRRPALREGPNRQFRAKAIAGRKDGERPDQSVHQII